MGTLNIPPQQTCKAYVVLPVPPKPPVLVLVPPVLPPPLAILVARIDKKEQVNGGKSDQSATLWNLCIQENGSKGCQLHQKNLWTL